jgi:hypothetical protein
MRHAGGLHQREAEQRGDHGMPVALDVGHADLDRREQRQHAEDDQVLAGVRRRNRAGLGHQGPDGIR